MLKIGDRVRIIGEDAAHQGAFSHKVGVIIERSGNGHMYSIKIDNCISAFCSFRVTCFQHAFYAKDVVKENASRIIKVI